MLCTKCGTEASDNARFCRKCGAQLVPQKILGEAILFLCGLLSLFALFSAYGWISDQKRA